VGVPQHDDLSELTGLYVLGALTGAERQAFEAHVAGCARCAAEVYSFEPVVAALGQMAPPADPSSSVRAQLLAAVSPAEPRGWRRTGWLAAAAALLVAIGASGYALRLRQQSQDQQAVARVLAAPDLARIDLTGQPVAPTASARALWSRSRGLVFTASNLPPLPAGRVYQLWVLSSQPAPMSAGLLKPDEAGRVTAMIPTPQDMPQPVAMAVTLEPDGGVPSPTGNKYLVGLAN
jgi:anti-sigma-K factor RskA